MSHTYSINNFNITCSDIELIIEESYSFRANYLANIPKECDHIDKLKNRLLKLEEVFDSLDKNFLCFNKPSQHDPNKGCINCDIIEVVEIGSNLNKVKDIIKTFHKFIEDKKLETTDFLISINKLSGIVEELKYNIEDGLVDLAFAHSQGSSLPYAFGSFLMGTILLFIKENFDQYKYFYDLQNFAVPASYTIGTFLFAKHFFFTEDAASDIKKIDLITESCHNEIISLENLLGQQFIEEPN